ncbi:hypothetical protein DB30_04380 [Enhygromyxa salina]|uniref:Uncharacterized protein n=1 Tax=Enhygromyxa salina TaxID=215803 RepID=A0A0C2D910_9BACT|nr:hypothetical protein DB30_04380 [Enhygromyxa salina]
MGKPAGERGRSGVEGPSSGLYGHDLDLRDYRGPHCYAFSCDMLGPDCPSKTECVLIDVSPK